MSALRCFTESGETLNLIPCRNRQLLNLQPLTLRRVAILLSLLALLAGCGTKGALYLPDDQQKTDNNSRR